MSLPSKAQQVAAVAKFLDSERNEGRELEDIAKDIVEGYLDALDKGIKKPMQPIRTGMLFKYPGDNKVRRVAWLEGHAVWLVSEDASYGWLGDVSGDLWPHCEEFRPKKRTEVEGKLKLAEMTDDEIAEAWDNPNWSVGDRLTLPQLQNTFQVVAVGPKCVLMQTADGGLISDSNTNLDRYYRREVVKEVW